MAVDIARLTYHVDLITETGSVYDLDHALLSLSWEEQEGQLAQRATLKLANYKMGSGYLMSLVKINCVIKISANWGGGNQPLFQGTIWEWDYASAQTKELTITAYDPLIRLQQSKDFKYFSAGMSTPAILGNICGDWGIPLSYKWSKQITHEKKVFNCDAISDMIIKLLEEVEKQTSTRYVALYKDGSLVISDYGTNSEVYQFNTTNSISTSDKLTINNLVTRVKIIGKEDSEGRVSVDAVIDGNLEYGVLQEVVRRDSNKTMGEANAEAQAILKERGNPEESITLNSADLPFLRRGDAVGVSAGNLVGTFYVIGVSHNATMKQMTMTLRRKG